jgi:hypothetical protein
MNGRHRHPHRRRHHRRPRSLETLEEHQRDLEQELADTVDAIRRWHEEPAAPRRRGRRRERA